MPSDFLCVCPLPPNRGITLTTDNTITQWVTHPIETTQTIKQAITGNPLNHIVPNTQKTSGFPFSFLISVFARSLQPRDHSDSKQHIHMMGHSPHHEPILHPQTAFLHSTLPFNIRVHGHRCIECATLTPLSDKPIRVSACVTSFAFSLGFG